MVSSNQSSGPSGDWGDLLFQPEADHYVQEPSLTSGGWVFFGIMGAMIGMITLWMMALEFSIIWLILLIPGFALFYIIYNLIVTKPFRIYERGVTRTRVSLTNGLRKTEELLPFDTVTAIELGTLNILYMEDLVFRYRDDYDKEMEYFPFRQTDFGVEAHNPLDIYHVLVEKVPDKFDDEVLREIRNPALFKALIRKIEEETTLEKGCEISRDSFSLIYFFSLPATMFFMAGICLFLAIEFGVVLFIPVAVICLSYGGYLAVDAILETKLSIMGRMAYEGHLKDGAIEIKVGRWERSLFEVRERIELASVSRVRVLINAWHHEAILMCYFSSGERYIFPPSLSKSIVESINGIPEGFSIINPAASGPSRIITLRKGWTTAFFLAFCSVVVMTTFSILWIIVP